MTIQIGADPSGDPVRDGLGCVLWAVGIAIVAWAFSGFPGLPR